MVVTAILSGLTAFVLHSLQQRLAAAEQDLRRAWAGGGGDLGQLFRNYSRSAVTSGLLPAAAGSALAGMRVRYRDHNDRFMSVAELMQEIDAKAGSNSFNDLVRLVRYFYQLEYTLGASPDLGGRVLGELERRIKANDGTRQVGRIERVTAGQRCDTQKMTPVRSGSYVEQPLGFVIYSPDNKVIARADVLCR